MSNAKLSRGHLQALVDVFGPDDGVQFTQATWSRIRQTLVALLEDTQQSEAVPDIDRMATRLMGWKLPADFNPDGRIGFDRIGLDAKGYPIGWPTGTNLLTHEQARAMFEYVLKDQS